MSSKHSSLRQNSSLSRLGNTIVSNRSSINHLTVAKSSILPNSRSESALSLNSVIPKQEELSAPSIHITPPPKSSQPASVKSEVKSAVKPRKLQPRRPPASVMNSLLAIYEVGNGYEANTRSFGRANGMGVLLNEHLCMTAHNVIPNEKIAIMSFGQFRSNEVYKFDPYRLFVTSEELNFTIVAFQAHAQNELKYLEPIDIQTPFAMEPEEPVFFLPLDHYHLKKVLLIEDDHFTFTSGIREELLPGTPIFNIEWEYQGMYINSSRHINQARRSECIIYYLDYIVTRTQNALLKNYLYRKDPGYTEDFFDRFFYYFEWFGKGIYRYDIDRESWGRVQYQTSSQLPPEMIFNWNHRLIYLSDGSVLVLGGRSQLTGTESSEVLQFSPKNHYIVSKLMPMLCPREGLACINIKNYVYVMGGLPHSNTCERFSLNSQRWQPIASMFYDRSEAAVSTAFDMKYIFIFGGEPLQPSGKTIERYNVEFNHWELLSLIMPKALSRLSVFPISNRRIAIMGGTESYWVFVFKIEDLYEVGNVYVNSNSGISLTYVIEECGRGLDQVTETAHPCAFCRTTNKLYLLHVTENFPEVIEYPVEYFDLPSRVDYSNKPLEIRARMRTPY